MTYMTDKATQRSSTNAYQIYSFLQRAFLLLMLVGYVFYPLDLWILGHWLETWQSRIPFLITVPSVILTVLMVLYPRIRWIRQTFIILMILNMLTGIFGATFHFFWNFEGEIDWSFKGIKDAFEGTRPVFAPMAFAHIGFTGLLCSFLPTLPTTTPEGV